ncbi:MAG TPA: hypothetical protein VMU43_11025 [Candidatus Acidoferrum sp.]|nr:hypothetical protein [Candidatus Acidoferrum sp.]
MLNRSKYALIVLLAFAALPATTIAHSLLQPQEKKNYLTDYEADKIRDTQDPGERIRLYISYAEERLKQFQYELARKTPEGRRGDILNSLLNGYVGCFDDGTDEIEVARERQVDIRSALQLFDKKGKEFLAQLQKINKNSPDYDMYSDTLQDAVEGTQEDLHDIEAALKELNPAPVRRKPS